MPTHLIQYTHICTKSIRTLKNNTNVPIIYTSTQVMGSLSKQQGQVYHLFIKVIFAGYYTITFHTLHTLTWSTHFDGPTQYMGEVPQTAC